MEKKQIKYKFFLVSLVNIVPALILGGGFSADSLFLIGALLILMINHYVLIKLVSQITQGTLQSNATTRNSVLRLLGLIILKIKRICSLELAMMGQFWHLVNWQLWPQWI